MRPAGLQLSGLRQTGKPQVCTWRVLRVPRQYIGTQTGLLGPGGGGVDCRLQYPLVSRIPRKGRPAVGSQV